MNTVIPLIILLVLYAGYMYYKTKTNNLTIVKSKVDNKEYIVRNLPDKQQAADTLAKLNQNIQKLINHVYEKHKNDTNQFIRDGVIRLKNNYNPNKINEAAYDKNYTTYTMNKSDMHYCLRSRDSHNNEQLESLNTLMFVGLHELGHMCDKSYSIQKHTESFRKHFTFLVKNAIQLGIYNHKDYQKEPVRYCGMNITDNPV